MPPTPTTTTNKCRLTGISAEESLTQRPQSLIGALVKVSGTSPVSRRGRFLCSEAAEEGACITDVIGGRRRRRNAAERTRLRRVFWRCRKASIHRHQWPVCVAGESFQLSQVGMGPRSTTPCRTTNKTHQSKALLPACGCDGEVKPELSVEAADISAWPAWGTCDLVKEVAGQSHRANHCLLVND